MCCTFLCALGFQDLLCVVCMLILVFDCTQILYELQCTRALFFLVIQDFQKCLNHSYRYGINNYISSDTLKQPTRNWFPVETQCNLGPICFIYKSLMIDLNHRPFFLIPTFVIYLSFLSLFSFHLFLAPSNFHMQHQTVEALS